MKSLSELIEEFRDMGGRVAFSARGIHHEGYIVEITSTDIGFYSGGPMADDIEMRIPLEVLDLDSLFFYDEKDRIYKNAKWDERKSEWRISVDKVS